jgi:hypothetical protein
MCLVHLSVCSVPDSCGVYPWIESTVRVEVGLELVGRVVIEWMREAIEWTSGGS